MYVYVCMHIYMYIHIYIYISSVSSGHLSSSQRPVSTLLHLPVVKDYQKCILKHSKLLHQKDYMHCTMTNGCIPKGIHDQSKFILSFTDTNLHSICQQLLYFAASRVSDVIRNNLSVKIASLRQAVFKSDERLRKALSIAEYYDILEETSKIIAKHNTEDKKKHTRKLERDRTDCNHYIPWQSFADVQIRKKRNSRAKKKYPRVSSRKMKRRNIKALVSALALIDSENQESSSPPPVINLANSITLTEGHFGISKKGPKFVPTPRKADFAEFQEDIRIWKNRLRWAVYHDLKKSEPDNISHDDETSPIELALIKSNKSKFGAPLSKNLALELFLQKVDIEIKNHKEKKNLGDNLSTDERKVLQDIRSWSDVIIRPYDKGVGFAIDEVEN